ncbi:unnamed protein product [Enterobius vermicularis]|uniref:Guanylate cyclase n=1 Tax=Enterobius vermicularis TaxID=51028 RepID=A0A0N4UUI4_ENTVE|nr:unnamed protein product [Enterobius vermicularis]
MTSHISADFQKGTYFTDQNSITSSEEGEEENVRKKERYGEIYTYEDCYVLVRRHKAFTCLSEEDIAELRYMIKLDNEYLNRFFGVSLNRLEILAIWKHCERNSIDELISNSVVALDSFFMICIIKDIAKGIAFLHNSDLKFHGRLMSKNCLVTATYQVKLSDFGLTRLRANEKYSRKELLYMAPEVLRANQFVGSQSGDIYSFAIVATEILTRKPAWDLENREETAEELLYMIKRSYEPCVRPELKVDPELNVNLGLLCLIRDCWADNPRSRPNTAKLLTLLKAMSDCLLDHLSLVLEKQAKNLELEVEKRTCLLAQEKIKTDEVLRRLLPPRIAASLKNGEHIEPEFYESATLMLSDLVSFTKIASRCTPLQVVTLLDGLYAALDAVIKKYDIYKVETIGDGYFCVSGLPNRNGNKHAHEIAKMALEAVKCYQMMKVNELPEFKIAARIGIHTGPCIAGVVGITNPRYCIFGESVTIAAMMESSGKGGIFLQTVFILRKKKTKNILKIF